MVHIRMDPALQTLGVKGSDVYTAAGVESPLLALSVQLVRGVANEVVNARLTEAIKTSSLEDIFVLLFQTRDIRGGKGERDASMAMWNHLLSKSKTTALALDLMDLIPTYGCWQDIFKFPPVAWARMLDIVEAQIAKDESDIASGASASLLAKWIPREGKPMATYCASRLVPGQMVECTRMRAYRKRISALNRAIQTVEISMCADKWNTIDPAKVPGRAMKKYTKAFLNELHTGKDLRHPKSEVRMLCRENFQEYFSNAAEGTVKAKGADTLYPHEVLKKAMSLSRREHSQDEKNSLIAVWRQMVQVAKEKGGLRKALAMCDFSGSMQSSDSNGDTPYWVSMALGILISELNTGDFSDMILTFDSTPTFHRFPEGDLFDKIKSITPSMAIGTSTDFQKAMDLVLSRLIALEVKPGDEPDTLIVLTDMNWDEASGGSEYDYNSGEYKYVLKMESWQTHVEMTRAAFEKQGWKMPTIVIWNIASTSPDFHAQASTEGVMMLSGWSPSLFKILQADGPEAAVITPMKALRMQLDDPRYDLVRERVNAYLKNY